MSKLLTQAIECSAVEGIKIDEQQLTSFMNNPKGFDRSENINFMSRASINRMQGNDENDLLADAPIFESELSSDMKQEIEQYISNAAS